MTRGPNYQVFHADLTAAGSLDYIHESNFFVMHYAEAGGVLAPSARVTVKLGRAVDDAIPIGLNGKIFGLVDRYRISWDAQPGVTAFFTVSRPTTDGRGIEVDAPPAIQLVTSAIAVDVAHGAVTIGTSASAIRAANGNRQSLIVQNLGAAAIYLGGSGVTTANGLEVASGNSAVIDKTTAAIYGISGSAGNDVRYFEEGAP